MPIQPVISNNSPLVGLLGINLLSLLRDLYTEVWIPRKVEEETLPNPPSPNPLSLPRIPLTTPQKSSAPRVQSDPHGI